MESWKGGGDALSVDRLRWALRLRSGIAPAIAALFVLGRVLTGIPFPLVPVLMVAAGALLYNAILRWGVSWLDAAGAPTARGLLVGGAGGILDFIALGLFVYFTGGVESPWIYYPIIPLVINAVILPPLATVLLVGFGGGALSALYAAAAAGWIAAPVPPGLILAARSGSGLAALEILNFVFLLAVLAYAMGYLRAQERGTQAELRRLAEDREAFLETTRELSVSLDPEQVLHLLAERSAALVRCDFVGIVLLDPEAQRMRAVAIHGVGEVPLGAVEEVAGGVGPVDLARLLSAPVITLPDPAFPRLTPALERFGCMAAILVRIEYAQIRGWAGFGSRSAQPLDERQVSLAQGVARYAAIAVANAELYRASQRSSGVSAALAEVARQIGATLDAEELLAIVTRATREAMQTEWVVAYVWDEEREVLRPAAWVGLLDENVEEVRNLDLSLGLVPVIDQMREGAVAVLPDRDRDDEFSAAVLRRWGVSSAVAALIMRGERRLGLLVTGQGRQPARFSDSQKALLRGIATYVAAAMDNARLHRVAQAANQLKSDFLATMSHELRTPLNVIIGYGDLMAEGAFGALNEQQRDVVDSSRRKATQLLDLINDTLDLNRLESGRDPVERTTFLLRTVCAEVETEVADVERAAGVVLRWEVPASFPALTTDRSKLKLALKNLVSNAMKFTKEGAVVVSAGTDGADGAITIRVADTGPGIAPEDLPVIFEMFRQGRGKDKARNPGVGLGLHIAKRFVERLGGTIRVESEIGKGSVFEIWMPLDAIAVTGEKRQPAGADGH